MYKVASDKRQAALHRGRLADWANGAELSTEAEQRSALKLAIQNLDARIQILPKGSEERKTLGLQKLSWQNELGRLGKIAKAGNIESQTVANCFVEIAKEQLSPAVFSAMIAGAKRLAAQHAERAQHIRDETSG